MIHPFCQAGSPLMPVKSLLQQLNEGVFDETFRILGSAGGADAQRSRVDGLIRTFASLYGEEREIALFSVAGRSEISGNHTDHNHGSVIAASVSLDILCVASPRPDGIIRLRSAGYPEDTVCLATDLTPDERRFGTSGALIAGVCDGFRKEGYAIGGFDACTVSDVLKGSGLSSSAAFEDMIGLVESHLYNGGKVDAVTISKLSQYAENGFFGKPCGLMDQMACAVGGIVAMDFADPAVPVIEPVPFDMTGAGYHLCIVNTGGNHADLTEDYAAVPREMKAVAAVFGKEVLRDVPEHEVREAIPTLRKQVGDRAVLRALHFYAENRRVAAGKAALLKAGSSADEDTARRALQDFFGVIRASGRSSFCYLQNVYTVKNTDEQGLSLALCLCESLLDGEGAFRVHGGGFAGTIQAFVPKDKVPMFVRSMDAVFGEGSAMDLKIRPAGAVRLA